MAGAEPFPPGEAPADPSPAVAGACATCQTRAETGLRIFNPIECAACLDAYDELTERLGGEVDKRRTSKWKRAIAEWNSSHS